MPDLAGPDPILSQDITWLLRLPQYVNTYFENFHPTLPILHRPTFDLTRAKEPLIQAVACIGATCLSGTPDHHVSTALFEAGHNYLERYVRIINSRIHFAGLMS